MIPSTLTGIIASQVAVIVAVVLNVTVGDAVLLLDTVAVIPVGQLMLLTFKLIHDF